ncbi:MAG: CHASE2 domain-containing protein [Neptuniibacter sp.]
MFSRLKLAHKLALICISALSISVFFYPFQSAADIWYDIRSRLYVVEQSDFDSRFVIVDIDEKSLQSEGRWPWPRTRISELLQLISDDYQAAHIGVDILFPDITEEDHQFYSELKSMPITLAQAFQFSVPHTHSSPLNKGQLQTEVHLVTADAAQIIPIASGYLGLNTLMGDSDWQAGHITPDIDSDGKVRQIAPLISWGDSYYEMLALALARQILMLPPEYSLEKGNGFGARFLLKNGPLKIALNDQGRLRIPYSYLPERRVNYVSAVDLFEGRVELSEIEGKIVILGSTSTGLYDQIATPVASIFPAVELHTNLLAALLDNQWRYQPEWSMYIQLVIVWFLLLLSAISFENGRNRLVLSVLTSVTVAWALLSLYLWQHHIDLQIWPVVLSYVFLLAIYLPAELFYQVNERSNLQALFSSYVPPVVVESLLKQPGDVVGISPEKKEMTVLFADLRGFTALSEQTAPEDLAKFMNRVFDVMTEAVHRHGGTVDKYMGDALMAFWGAPLADEDHALNAVKSAMAIQNAIIRMSKQLVESGQPAIAIGIGINTGEMVVGDMGSSFRRSYTVIGDSVNQAARLQKLTRKHKLHILLGERTAELLPDGLVKRNLRELGMIDIHGRKEPAKIYALPPMPANSKPTNKASSGAVPEKQKSATKTAAEKNARN